ncbi:MAG: amino acid ABC transporter substrate-binding protein [Anaerolineae bacterium]|nr:amino acid ABC transporter substrate-binding protein [Anaerolineae bacterium]
MKRYAVIFRNAVQRWRDWAVLHPRVTLVIFMAVAVWIAYWQLTRPGALFGPQDLTWHRVQVNRDLYVGVDPNYPPFAEWTPEAIVGLEADLAREIGRRLGVETQVLIMGYDGLYDALYTGTVDMIISGLQIDLGRVSWVHYSQPYFDAGQILISLADAPVGTIRDLDGKTLAVEFASAGDLEALRWQRRLHALAIERFMLPDEAMQAVQQGQADAALVDTVSARLYLKQHNDLVMADDTVYSEAYRIAMRQQNFRLIEAVEQVLDDMQTDGTLEAIIDRWL